MYRERPCNTTVAACSLFIRLSIIKKFEHINLNQQPYSTKMAFTTPAVYTHSRVYYVCVSITHVDTPSHVETFLSVYIREELKGEACVCLSMFDQPITTGLSEHTTPQSTLHWLAYSPPFFVSFFLFFFSSSENYNKLKEKILQSLVEFYCIVSVTKK